MSHETTPCQYDELKVVEVDIRDGIANVYLNNPPINLYDVSLVGDVSKVGRLLRDDPNVRVVVVRSKIPGFFLCHADVTLTRAAADRLTSGQQQVGQTPNVVKGGDKDYAGMLEPFRTMPKPTIAVIEGRCAGGGIEFIQACDMQFAADTAIFNQWEVSFGIVPGAGGLTRLARRLGRCRAMEVCLGCDDLDANTASLYGLINRAMPAADLESFIDRLTKRLLIFSELTLASAKEGILESIAIPTTIPDGREEVLADQRRAMALMADPENRVADRITKFLELGGQTPEGESRFGDLLGEIKV